MIVRILGEGQFTVQDGDVEGLNELDASVESAIKAGDEPAFATALEALLRAVRSGGTPLPDEELVESDSVLPPADATISDVQDLLNEDGLIPG